jgi:hypothetical protein
MKSLFSLSLILLSFSAHAADYCVTGLKGTVTSSFTFKISQNRPNDRSVTVIDANKNQIFASKTENQFTKFNSTGYGVCSVTAQGIDDATGAQYHLELKLSPHYQKPCSDVTFPTSVEYLTLKIVPKGTTLGDDLTAYALSVVPCL